MEGLVSHFSFFIFYFLFSNFDLLFAPMLAWSPQRKREMTNEKWKMKNEK